MTALSLTGKPRFHVPGYYVCSQTADMGAAEVTGITVDQLARVSHGLSSLVCFVWMIAGDVSLQVLLGLYNFTAVGAGSGYIVSDKSLKFS